MNAAGSGLTAEERALLDFERGWWTEPAVTTKREAIRTRLQISVAAYYTRLARLAETAEARSYDPLVVARVRRRRAARRRALFVPAGEPSWHRRR